MSGCNRKRICGECEECYEKSFASYYRSKNWSPRNPCKPRYISKYSNKKYWFICECGHEFEIRLNDAVRGKWCQYCANQKLCGECESCYQKSFASDPRSKYWSPKNILKPLEVFKHSSTKYWFNCYCGHEFEASLSKVSDGKWCPYCANKKLCGNCESCYQKSFASDPRSKYWSSRNILKPEEVFKYSLKKIWFDCYCNHAFESALNSISQGSWCPYCANKKLCGNCESCYQKSFAVYYRSKYWSPKNILLPKDVFISSASKYWFICENYHNFESSLHTISSGVWCPFCFNKTEAKMNEYLKSLNIVFIKEAKFIWCISSNGVYRRFDFYLPKYKLVIEIDGDQHFRKVLNWKSHVMTTYIDVYKAKLALQRDISLIRIYQENVLYDSLDWRKIIQDNLIEREVPAIEYFSKRDLYQEHIKLMKELSLEELNQFINQESDNKINQVINQESDNKIIKIEENVENNITKSIGLITYNKKSLGKMSMEELKEIAKNLNISDINSYRERTKKGKCVIINDICNIKRF